jgi:hypothetical protein
MALEVIRVCNASALQRDMRLPPQARILSVDLPRDGEAIESLEMVGRWK